MSDADGCLFCRIVRGEIPARKVFETPHCIAFDDIQPRAPVHVLVIPKAHIASTEQAGEADVETLGHLLLAARRVAVEKGCAESGYRMVMNTGADAGQSVFHMHLHVLGGRPLAWPPG